MKNSIFKLFGKSFLANVLLICCMLLISLSTIPLSAATLNGRYHIESKAYPGRELNASGNFRVYLEPVDAKWEIRPAGDKVYIFKNVLHRWGIFFTYWVKERFTLWGNYPDAPVNLWRETDDPCQRWYLEPIVRGTYRIKSACNHQYITAKSNPHEQITVRDYRFGDVRQQWIIRDSRGRDMPSIPGGPPLQNGIYEIKAKHSGKCLDVRNHSVNDRANVHQWTCHTEMPGYEHCRSQHWRVESDSNNVYRVVAMHSGKCLDVHGSLQVNGGNVYQYTCHGGDNQSWYVIPHNGAYRLIAKHSDKCLEVRGASHNDGKNVYQFGCHGRDNQTWLFRKLP